MSTKGVANKLEVSEQYIGGICEYRNPEGGCYYFGSSCSLDDLHKMGDGKMDDKDWAKQYVESVDRCVSEIRREIAENRREAKSDIREYINAVNSKIDQSVNETREMKADIKKEIDGLKENYASSTKHIQTMNTTVMIGLIGIFLAFAAVVVALIYKAF